MSHDIFIHVIVFLRVTSPTDLEVIRKYKSVFSRTSLPRNSNQETIKLYVHTHTHKTL